MGEAGNKMFEEELKNFQKEIIDICLNAVGDTVDTICAYCSTENGGYSFNMFTLVEKNVRTLGQLDIEKEKIEKCLTTGTMKLPELDGICQKYNEPQPTEMKIVYDVKAETFEVEYQYKPVLKRKSAGEVFMAWVEAYRHPKEEKPKKAPAKKGIALKKGWVHKQDGARGPMISESAVLRGQELIYFFKYEKDGFGESQLKCLDLLSQEEKSLFTEKHIIRDMGIAENGRRYFTSMSRKLYCIDESTGAVIWETKVEDGNTAWEISADENNIYMFSQHLYAIDKASGEIVWKSPENLKHSKCSMAINDKYVYRGNSGGGVFAFDKTNGEIAWQFGNDMYGGHCILLSEEVLLVTAAVKGFGKVYLLKAETGELISEMDMEMGCNRRPLVEGNMVYLGNALGEMKCFEVTPENALVEKFSYKADANVTTEPVLDGDILWFATEKGNLYGLNKETGEEIMKKKKVGAVPRWISVYEDGLLILSDKGQVEYYQK